MANNEDESEPEDLGLEIRKRFVDIVIPKESLC